MAIDSSLAYTHSDCDFGKRHTVVESKPHDAPGLRRYIRLYKAINSCNGFLIRRILSIIFFIVKKIAVGNALMNLAVTDMVQTTVDLTALRR